jgi:hypothetical protein
MPGSAVEITGWIPAVFVCPLAVVDQIWLQSVRNRSSRRPLMLLSGMASVAGNPIRGDEAPFMRTLIPLQIPPRVTLSSTVTGNTVRARCLACNRPFVAKRRSAQTCSDGCRQTLSRTRRAATPLLPSGPFDLIIADPPWHFTTHSEKGQGRSASRPRGGGCTPRLQWRVRSWKAHTAAIAPSDDFQ